MDALKVIEPSLLRFIGAVAQPLAPTVLCQISTVPVAASAKAIKCSPIKCLLMTADVFCSFTGAGSIFITVPEGAAYTLKKPLFNEVPVIDIILPTGNLVFILLT